VPNPASSSAALPLAHALLRFLVVANWIVGALIAVLLFGMPVSEWIRKAIGIAPGPEADQIIFGLVSIAAIGLATIPLNFIILKRLIAIVETVRDGNPFVVANAQRLEVIARTLLVLEILGIIIGVIAKAISTPAHPININRGFSLNGWLAILLTFLLARVFAEGAVMRDDLEGTV
jgi:hypothetical protein